MVLGLLAMVISGCGDPGPKAGSVGHVKDYFGGLASDEPQSALVGRDVLSAGGSAVDAVVAMGLTMMVTRPDAAGPGGGGMCLVYDSEKNVADSIEFLPHAARTPPLGNRWIAAAPGSFRGLFALHARYGKLRWEQLVLPAERMARFGLRIPRVLTRVLAKKGAGVIKDEASRAVFFDRAGKPLKEGDRLRQVDLAALLGRVRITGPGDFYSGVAGRKFVEGVREAGGWLTMNDLRDYRPTWQKTTVGSFGVHDVHFLPSPSQGGRVAAGIWRELGDRSGFSKSGDGKKHLQLIDASRRAYAAALAQPQADTATAGAIVIDRDGNSAACVMTMNRPFGSGRMAGETGIIPTVPADVGSTLAMSAMLVTNKNTKQTFLAATGTGDDHAPVALMAAALRALDGGIPVEKSLSATRAAPVIRGGDVVAEPGALANIRSALGDSGGPVREVPAIGQVNMMYCPDGITEKPEKCAVKNDPRGFGYAINAEF
jgi:gamma-glutamyltranspeptidase/glutathione hydrolase